MAEPISLRAFFAEHDACQCAKQDYQRCVVQWRVCVLTSCNYIKRTSRMQVKVSGARAGSGSCCFRRKGKETHTLVARGSSASLANNGFAAAQHRGHVKIMCLAHSENSRNISAGSKLLMFWVTLWWWCWHWHFHCEKGLCMQPAHRSGRARCIYKIN